MRRLAGCSSFTAAMLHPGPGLSRPRGAPRRGSPPRRRRGGTRSGGGSRRWPGRRSRSPSRPRRAHWPRSSTGARRTSSHPRCRAATTTPEPADAPRRRCGPGRNGDDRRAVRRDQVDPLVAPATRARIAEGVDERGGAGHRAGLDRAGAGDRDRPPPDPPPDPPPRPSDSSSSASSSASSSSTRSLSSCTRSSICTRWASSSAAALASSRAACRSRASWRRISSAVTATWVARSASPCTTLCVYCSRSAASWIESDVRRAPIESDPPDMYAAATRSFSVARIRASSSSRRSISAWASDAASWARARRVSVSCQSPVTWVSSARAASSRSFAASSSVLGVRPRGDRGHRDDAQDERERGPDRCAGSGRGWCLPEHPTGHRRRDRGYQRARLWLNPPRVAPSFVPLFFGILGLSLRAVELHPRS